MKNLSAKSGESYRKIWEFESVGYLQLTGEHLFHHLPKTLRRKVFAKIQDSITI